MNRTDEFVEVREIADAVCSGIATPEQLAKLEALLEGNFDAQKFYYDYVKMHMQLTSPAEQQMELVFRRMTEEVVLRPKEERLVQDIQPPKKNKRILALGVILFFCLMGAFIWVVVNQSSTSVAARLTKGSISIYGHGDLDGDAIYTGNYRAEQAATLTMENGDILHFTAMSTFKLYNNREVKLRKGKVRVEATANHNTIVHGKTYIIQSNGSGLTLDLTKQQPVLTSGENTLLIPERWRPKHYYSFDGQSDRVVDSAGSAYGIAASGATRTQGYVGKGAFMFDNSANARIELGSGGGTALGTGTFAVTDGVTIEALVRPDFSGEYNELDEIFRKDHGDEHLRMLFSFQHDSGKHFVVPAGDYKESLSFGLYILGQGYHELKVALDGQEGRPNLADLKDGNFHHVVATYNSGSGLKAIYINGEMHASYQYPPGSKVLSGGPGMAAIGNIPTERRWHMEAFSGAIDEVAFYDYALPQFMLRRHFENTQQGNNYFGFTPSDKPLPMGIKLPLPTNITVRLSPLTGLPDSVVNE